MGTVKTLLTFEEFEQLPDQPGKRELVRGEVIELPPAKLEHNRIADRICDRLKAAIRQA
jgi:Uma2 family endonuclease